MRRTVTTVTLLAGVLLMLVGFFASAPWGADTVANSDPRFDFAPLFFVIGVVVAFSAALVYELFPGRDKE